MARAAARKGPRTDASGRGIPDAHVLLERAVEEAARLLEADGAMVYLVEGDRLRFACDAGIGNAEARQLIRDLELPLGVGLFGHAASTGETIVAGDYRRDRRFKHSAVADRIVLIANMRSMAAAPLIAGGEVIGAIGAYSSRIDDFSEAEVALLRALADHAAAGIANQRLVEQSAASEARFRHLVLSSPDLVWETDAVGRFTILSDPLTALTGWTPDDLVGQPWSAIVAPESMDDANATWAGLQSEPTVVRKIRFMLRRREGDPIPAEVYAIGSQRDGEFLGAHGSIRDLSAAERQADQLRDQTEELERLVDAQRTLAEMAAQLTSVREPSDVLIQALRAAVRLLKGSGGQIGMIVTDAAGDLRWGDGHSLVHGRLVPFTKQDHSRVEEGVSGRAVRERHVSWTDDYLADTTFPHESGADASARRLGVR
ncbi:MAG: GAF domain-containing protein, partial [Chloroflexi bacterium]|nr:GAF domain-containing protein [Chloroflexota bacterium]